MDDLIQDFYVPALGQCVHYDRIAGFFSSTSLAVAAQGVAGLIRNNGKIRLLCSPRLSAEDIRAIQDCTQNADQFICRRLLDDLDAMADDFEREHVRVLGWMLANGFLEIRLVQVKGPVSYEALFHQKIGIMEDGEEKRVSFSGSINESASFSAKLNQRFPKNWRILQR